MSTPVITRFAPSPTGFLHIGGARTALFNWLYAKHTGGQFLLRIEDTDRARSTPEATAAILSGLKWLGMDWDGDVFSQFDHANRHAEVAATLVENAKGYKCTCTPDELTAMREAARTEGRPMRYDGRCRDKSAAELGDAPYVVRLKAEHDGETIIQDMIQGEVKVDNAEIDDFVLLRADGTPTYMLAVVCDDFDMNITHVIRGDDHLTNTFRQIHLYKAMGWPLPVFAHMPLLHGADGKKLSKRHGALGVEAYEEMGFLPKAINNYLLRLGWGHGDDEIISTEQAIKWFDVVDVGRAAARFDMDKLTHLNAHYIKNSVDGELAALVAPKLEAALDGKMAEGWLERVQAGMADLKERAKTINELVENAGFYAQMRPLAMNEKAAKILNDEARERLNGFRGVLADQTTWGGETLEAAARAYAEAGEFKLGQVAQPLRAALTGSNTSPPIFAVMAVLGQNEVLGRIDDALKG